MGNIYYCHEKNRKDYFTPHISMSEICDSPLIIYKLPSTKNRRNVLNTYSLSDRQFEDGQGYFGA
jgi:hypothetical protein